LWRLRRLILSGGQQFYYCPPCFIYPKIQMTMGDYNKYQSCIEICLKCVAACNHCAASCMREADVQKMVDCIRLDMECAAICYSSAQLMSLGSSRANSLCAICADICEACGAECGKHNNEHCTMCAETCAKCAEACRRMAA